ncbi:MAG: hypothetical protein RLZZ127_2016 [Planctomycetota bacterium]|jgi:hypothetical protein
MRYADAPHVDLGDFRTRRSARGRTFQILGLLCCCGAVIATDLHANGGSKTLAMGAGWTFSFQAERLLAGLLIVSLLGWLRAWHAQVGTMWRQPLVAACAANATALTWIRLTTP